MVGVLVKSTIPLLPYPHTIWYTCSMISPTIYNPGDLLTIDTKGGPAVILVTDYVDGYVQIIIVDYHEDEHILEDLWVTAKTLDDSNPRTFDESILYM